MSDRQPQALKRRRGGVTVMLLSPIPSQTPRGSIIITRLRSRIHLQPHPHPPPTFHPITTTTTTHSTAAHSSHCPSTHHPSPSHSRRHQHVRRGVPSDHTLRKTLKSPSGIAFPVGPSNLSSSSTTPTLALGARSLDLTAPFLPNPVRPPLQKLIEPHVFALT